MKLKLDSILLFALVIPFVMNVRLSWGTTPYWLFGLILLGLLIYILIDLLKIKQNSYHKLKLILLWSLIIGVLGSAFTSAIIVRHKTHPVYQIHDMPLQQEIAIRFMLDGKNPYSAHYFGTPLEEWHYSDKEINPALYHFVLLPFYIIFALPFYFVSNLLFGFFDARMPLLFLFFLLLFVTAKLSIEEDRKRIFLVLLTFNPAILEYTLEGRSDIFMFSFLFLGLFLLHKGKLVLAGIPIALAFAVKQSAWPILPFYIAFLYFKVLNITRTMKLLLLFVGTLAVILGPLILWDAKAFFDSTVFYLSGSASNSYPISGYGLGMVLKEIGVIGDIHQYYPFQIWQLLIGLPVFIILMRYLKKAPSVARLILVYGIFLFVFWYFSRYLNNSHLGYLSMVFITAFFWPDDKK